MDSRESCFYRIVNSTKQHHNLNFTTNLLMQIKPKHLRNQHTQFRAIALIVLASFLACKINKQGTSYKSINYKSENEIKHIPNMIDQYYALAQGTFIFKVNDEKGISKDYMVYTIQPIFKNIWGERWLYSEIVMPNLLEDPVDQLVMKLEKHSVDTLYMYNYRIKERERFATGWYDTNKLDKLEKEDLIPMNKECYTIITKNKDGLYEAKDAGLCEIEDGQNKRTYYQAASRLDYKGIAVSTTLYDGNKEITQESSPFFLMERDLKGKYHQILYNQQKRSDKTQ